MLNAQIPGIDRRKANWIWPCRRSDQVAWIGQEARGRDRWERIRRWSRSQCECRRLVAPGRVDTLIRKYWQVLCDGMAEDRAENSEVKAASVPGTNHGLWIKLIGDTNAWCQCFPGRVPIHACSYTAYTCDADETVVELHQTAVPRTVDCFREIQFPAQSIVHRQFAGHAPGVLRVEEETLLKFLRIQRTGDISILDVSSKGGDITQNEGGKSETARSIVRGRSSAERKQSGAVRVAWDAEITSIAEVRSNFEGVVPSDFCPVIYTLELVLSFGGR